jgi:imidazolonepropionase-like amidohydrolase
MAESLAMRAGLLIAGAMGLGAMAGGIALDRAASRPRAPRPAAAAPQVPAGAYTAIVGARVFDGDRMLARATVVLEGDRIAAVGEAVPVPPGAHVIDGTGKTVLPGLIDAHTHATDGSLERALVFGVTTELDMFADPTFAARDRAEQARHDVTTRADLWSASVLVTAPGGHGTEFGFPIPTLASADQAQAFVDARIAEGSDYIKIVKDDGTPYGLTWPTLTDEELRAVVSAAHFRQKLTVVHIGTQHDAVAAIDAGADGLAHLFEDSEPAPDFASRVAAHRAFVVPTLTVLESETGRPSGASLVTDPRLEPFLEKDEVTALRSAFTLPHRLPSLSLDHACAAVRELAHAGVPLLAGTDAGNPGTAHGVSLHRELELLVAAGLTSTEALRAATSTPARVFRLLDRGRLAPGLRADVVLVDGDPGQDITATRAIVQVWRNGVVVARR